MREGQDESVSVSRMRLTDWKQQLAAIAGEIEYELSKKGPTRTFDELDAIYPTQGYNADGGVTRPPVVSNPFRPGVHDGVDIAFKNGSKREVRFPHQTKWFHHPVGLLAYAFLPGKIWDFGYSDRGWWVVIDHGIVEPLGPLTTFRTHLMKFTGLVVKGVAINSFDPVGVIGDDPSEPHDIIHQHFGMKVWNRPGVGEWIDPEPWLKKARILWKS